MSPASIRTGMIRPRPRLLPSRTPSRTSSLNDAVKAKDNGPDNCTDDTESPAPSMLIGGRMTAPRPNAATPAPSSPPTMAWLLERGMPARVATKTRIMDAPIATTIDRGVSALRVTMAVPIVAATAVVKRNGPITLQIAVRKRLSGRQGLGRHDRGYRVRGIVETVDEVQRKREDDAEQDEGFKADHEWAIAMSLRA